MGGSGQGCYWIVSIFRSTKWTPQVAVELSAPLFYSGFQRLLRGQPAARSVADATGFRLRAAKQSIDLRGGSQRGPACFCMRFDHLFE